MGDCKLPEEYLAQRFGSSVSGLKNSGSVDLAVLGLV